MEYTIDIDLENKPENLKIYADENMKNEIEVVEDKLSIKRFLKYADANNIQSHIFYWNWALETGSNEQEILENDIKDSEFMEKSLLMKISATGMQSELNGDNVTFYGNGATSGGVKNVITVDGGYTLSDADVPEKKYIVNLDANGGSVENSKLECEYKFSHWSIDARNENVLYYSDKEVNRKNSSNGSNNEFIWYTDLAPYIDEYGVGDYYLCFDLKSENISKYNQVVVYFQNGSSQKYWMDRGWTPVNVTTEFKRIRLNTNIILKDSKETKSMLAFFGNYGTGNYPVVKNVLFDVGKGYETGETIPIDSTSNSQLNLYAKWLPQSITLPTPTKPNSTFLGWYTAKEGGEKVNLTVTPTSNVTYYAHWQ